MIDPRLGPNLARDTRADDDMGAYHALAPGETETTLCGLSLDEVLFAFSMDSGFKPDDGAGCWTCLEASNRWATAA